MNRKRRRFEDEAQKGFRPCIELHLGAATEPERVALFRELLDVELHYLLAGERPTPDDYRARFPAYALAIDAVFKAGVPDRSAAANADRYREVIDAAIEEGILSPAGPAPSNVVKAPPSGPNGTLPPSPPQKAGVPDRSAAVANADPDRTATFSVETPGGLIEPPVGPAGHARLREAFAMGEVLRGRYVLERELGRGGMGLVYLGHDRRLRRPVAVKVILPPRPGPGIIDQTHEARRLERFIEEARLGAQLTHPAVATVHDYGVHRGHPFIVFEYLPGETLQDLLSRRGRLPLDEARLVLGPLAQALDYAHAKGVVHRDLKPANVRATEQGQFKLLDLGLAKEYRREGDWSGFAGTPAYAAPEQGDGRPCDGRADQYALALVAFEALAGRRLFRGGDGRALIEMHRHRDPARELEAVPAEARAALTQALHKDRNLRFTSCQAFAEAIGYQFVRPTSDPAVIFREVYLKKMAGQWPSVRWGLDLHRDGVHLVLTPDSLWGTYRGEVMRWPLGAITHLQTPQDRVLELRWSDGRRSYDQSFWVSVHGLGTLKNKGFSAGDHPRCRVTNLKADPLRPSCTV